MDLDKGVARHRASCAERGSPGDTLDRSRACLAPPSRILPLRIAHVRVLRDPPVSAASRKSQIASALNSLPVPSEELLQEYFDLTLAEVKLAQSLTRGSSLEEAARQLNIKMSTARTQLASIFAKTDSQR